MALVKINENPSTRELRKFAAIWFPIFWLIVASVFYFGAGIVSWAVTAAAFGVIIGAVGWLRPRFMHPVYLLWMYGSYPIGFVVSHLVLGAVYFMVVTPIGLILKLTGSDPLERKLRTGEPSYWVRCEQVSGKSQYFRQY